MLIADASEVETLKSALAQAKEEAKASKAAANKAAVELKTERVARRQHKERVAEVEQEPKDAIGKCEALEENNKAQAVELSKALQEAREAQTESREAREEIKQDELIAAGKPFLLQSKFGGQKMPSSLDYGVLQMPLRIFRRALLMPHSISGPKRGTRRRSSSGHSTWRRSVQRC